MICRLCHADHEGPELCAACVKDLATLYWSSGGLRRVSFPRLNRLSGAGRSAGVKSCGVGAMPAAACLGTAEAHQSTNSP
jgi:hypothetical protein